MTLHFGGTFSLIFLEVLIINCFVLNEIENHWYQSI